MQIIQSVQPDPNTRSTVPTVAALELFAGIGGAAIALRSISAEVRVAVDIDLHALQVYRDNFPSHQTIAAEIASLDLSQFASNFWWLSPPCLPFTSKGRQRDLDDRRTDSLVAVLKQIPALLPEFVVLENVPPFAESRACRLTSALLEANGYQVAIEVRCPTELGYPMRRRRCFVVASRRGLRDLQPMSQPFKPLRTFLDPPDTPQRSVPETLHKAYRSAMDIVDEADPMRSLLALLVHTAAHQSAVDRTCVYPTEHSVTSHRARSCDCSDSQTPFRWPPVVTGDKLGAY